MVPDNAFPGRQAQGRRWESKGVYPQSDAYVRLLSTSGNTYPLRFRDISDVKKNTEMISDGFRPRSNMSDISFAMVMFSYQN